MLPAVGSGTQTHKDCDGKSHPLWMIITEIFDIIHVSSSQEAIITKGENVFHFALSWTRTRLLGCIKAQKQTCVT